MELSSNLTKELAANKIMSALSLGLDKDDYEVFLIEIQDLLNNFLDYKFRVPSVPVWKSSDTIIATFKLPSELEA